MPVNEISAPGTIKVSYTTDVPYPHVFRLYLDAAPTDVNADGIFETNYIDASHPSGWTVAEIVEETLARWDFSNSNMCPLVVDAVECWLNVSGANVFLGLDQGDYSSIVGGNAQSIAAAYAMYVFKSSNRNQFRLMIFDNGDAKPQRYAGSSAPVVDDGSLNWWMTRSAVKFVTNDNLRLATLGSSNTGYNRKLARSYGRAIQP